MCIRDRYQRRVRGSLAVMSILSVALLISITAASAAPFVPSCSPVPQFNRTFTLLQGYAANPAPYHGPDAQGQWLEFGFSLGWDTQISGSQSPLRTFAQQPAGSPYGLKVWTSAMAPFLSNNSEPDSCFSAAGISSIPLLWAQMPPPPSDASDTDMRQYAHYITMVLHPEPGRHRIGLYPGYRIEYCDPELSGIPDSSAGGIQHPGSIRRDPVQIDPGSTNFSRNNQRYPGFDSDRVYRATRSAVAQRQQLGLPDLSTGVRFPVCFAFDFFYH
eukprot:TRINITY_DN9513_c0_g2_i1.p1 TRINITY_DN9513_c0_g2~~TRINITY_DN9513_c0_g2_i1.p1  ORF type:complete len:273 (+),score=17.67 TRINITY_DN9513_c0_g2_i1:122-940(+)